MDLAVTDSHLAIMVYIVIVVPHTRSIHPPSKAINPSIKQSTIQTIKQLVSQQESCAIAKMTAQCALYMVP